MATNRGSRWAKFGAKRLSPHDYSSPGAYFVTICAHERRLLFVRSEVVNVIEQVWEEIPLHHRAMGLDAFVVMPNHVHGIVQLNERPATVVPQHAGALHQASLSSIVRSFKAAVTRELRLRDLHCPEPVWQPNYYDRVVRNDSELNRIREYIAANPIRWPHDHENPNRTSDEAYERAWSWLESGNSQV